MDDTAKTKTQLIQEVSTLRQRVAELETLATENKRMEETLRTTVEGTSWIAGQAFFQALVRHLAAALHVRFGFVSELIEPSETHVRLLAFWRGVDFSKTFDFEWLRDVRFDSRNPNVQGPSAWSIHLRRKSE